MKKKKPARKASAKSPPPRKASSDATCLKSFCDSVDLEEISLEQWESCQSALDVTIPLFLTKAEAAAGLSRELRFSRCVRESLDSPPKRQPAQCLVTVPPQALDGLQLRCPRLGDTVLDRQGDLLIIVRIKCGS